MAKLKSGTRIYGTATIDTSVVVGSAVTANSSGIQVTGVVTATSFRGDASQLTGVSASYASIAGIATNVRGAANRVLYNSATDTTTTSANLTFNGTDLAVAGVTTANGYRSNFVGASGGSNSIFVGNNVGLAVTLINGGGGGVTFDKLIGFGYDCLKYVSEANGGSGSNTWKTQIAIGEGCLQNVTLGPPGGGLRTYETNIAIGYQCGTTVSASDSIAARNVFVGYQIAFVNNFASAAYNNIFGTQSGYNLSSGTGNSLFGYQAGYNVTTGGYNVFNGYLSGYSNASGSYNIGIGYSAGQINLTGSQNVVIGYNRDVPISAGNNQLVIGSNTSDWIVGNSSYNVGIGTTRPTSKLYVVGDTYVTGILTANRIVSSVYGEFTGNTVLANNIVGASLSIAGISTFSGIATHAAPLFGTQASFTGVITASSFYGSGANLTGLVPNTVTVSAATTPQFIGFLTTSSGVTTSILASSTLTYIPSSGNLGIGTTNPTSTLQVGTGISMYGATGIVSAIRYYGDGSNLTGIINNTVATSTTTTPQFIGFSSVSSGINTSILASSTLTYIPSSGNLGIGTTNPTAKLYVVGDGYFTGVITATAFYGNGANLTGLVPNTVSTSTTTTPQFIGFSSVSSGITTSILASSTLTYIPSSGNLGIGTTNPTQTLHVQGNARITGSIVDSTGNTGTSGQVLQSTASGTQWTSSATAVAAGGVFDTTIDNALYVQPTGTLDIVGVGTTTSQITTLPGGTTTEYVVHSMHVTNVSNGDAEITAGFIINARKVPATISVSAGYSGGPGIHTLTVGSGSSITVGMAVTGTGNIGERTGIGTTAGFQFNTYVTSVDGNNITLSKPMSGYASGIAYFSPVSKSTSRLPVPVGSAVELLKQPMVLNGLDSIVLQSTGAGSGIAVTSGNTITYTSGSSVLTITNQPATFFNSIAIGNLVQNIGISTGIQPNTYVGASYTGINASYAGTGVISIPITRPVNGTVGIGTSLSFAEVVVPQDGALQTTVVYQTATDTSYLNGTGTATTTASVYYSTGLTYPSVIQSIRVSNISDGISYPGGDYPVSVGIGNSDTIFSWLAYNMVIPKNSSIELCEAPKRIGIGQSIFAFSNTPNAIEIQVAGKQRI